jgi:hypothetical protein
MPTRPCNPDADTKRLWQTLLPGMPLPACGTAEDDKPYTAEDSGLDKEALKKPIGR